MNNKSTTSPDRTTYAAIVGSVLTAMREAEGMDQATVAAQVGISQPTWSRIERGASALTIEQLSKAAAALGKSSAEIVQRVDDARSGLLKMNIVVDDERPPQGTQTTLTILAGAILGFLIAKAMSK